jgi:hypothetical protein
MLKEMRSSKVVNRVIIQNQIHVEESMHRNNAEQQ